MKIITHFQKILFGTVFFLSFCISYKINAQLSVNNSTYTTNQLVQNILLGNGISVSNITYNGVSRALGFFNGTSSNIGLDSGIIMTSGDIYTAVGPNNTDDATCPSDLNPRPGDPDLDLISPDDTYDAAVLEFDFIPVSDSISFRFVFGSEEYLEYVNQAYNDVFGFFISGPGISGPYSNNSTNIALIPGTTTPVTIDNVNDVLNNAYYIDNGNGEGTGTTPDGLTVQYDGFTTPITANAKVQCGKMYHIKLAIADAGDQVYDSGVFLEAGSFTSNEAISLNLAVSSTDTVCPSDLVPVSALITGTLSGTPIITWDFDGGEVISGSDFGPYQIKWTTPGTKKIKLTVQPSAIDTCGIRMNEFDVYITDCEVKAPNVFTPNNDGINEFLKFRNVEKYPNSELLIYDRWGVLIYTNGNYQNNWTAPKIPDGTYYYILSVSNEKKDIMKGFVTIIR